MSLLLTDFDEEVVPEELAELGSFNHGYIQIRLGVLLTMLDRFTIVSELSLDTTQIINHELGQKQEVKPDLCLYPKRSVNWVDDEIRMTEMPLLAIEILSPAQSQQSLLDKIKLLFALGIQSCWLVNPGLKTVAVFSSPSEFESFSRGEIIDQALNISLAHEQLFN